MHTSGPVFAIVQPVSSCGYGVTRTWRLHVLARPQVHLPATGLRSCGTPRARSPSCRIQPGTHVAPSSITPMRNVGMAHQHAVDDQRVQRLHHRQRDREIVDRLEVRVAAVEVGNRRAAVVEVVESTSRSRPRRPRAARPERPLPRTSPTSARARRGSASARRDTGRSRSRRVPAVDRLAGELDRGGHVADGHDGRRAAAADRPSTSRARRGAAPARPRPRARGRRRGRSAATCGLVNVSKTSWLANPRDRARRRGLRAGTNPSRGSSCAA